MRLAPALAKKRNQRVHRLDHQVHVDRNLYVRANRLAHQRPDGQVGHVMVVHHIKVHQVGTGRLYGAHLFAQAGKVG